MKRECGMDLGMMSTERRCRCWDRPQIHHNPWRENNTAIGFSSNGLLLFDIKTAAQCPPVMIRFEKKKKLVT